MLVRVWGEVWRISKPNLKKLLREFLEEKEHDGFDLAKHGGKLLGEAKSLTDLSIDSAEMLLDELGG